MNTQNYSYTQSQNIPQPTSNSVNFNNQPRSSQEQSEINHFFNKIKIIQIDTIQEINLLTKQHIIFHQMMENTKIEKINNFIEAKDFVFKILTNQILLNHTHEMNKYDLLEITQHLTTIFFNNKTQLIHNKFIFKHRT